MLTESVKRNAKTWGRGALWNTTFDFTFWLVALDNGNCSDDKYIRIGHWTSTGKEIPSKRPTSGTDGLCNRSVTGSLSLAILFLNCFVKVMLRICIFPITRDTYLCSSF